MKHPRQSATDWLWSRQEGKRGKFTERVTLSTTRFNPTQPAMMIAWNPRRLQNMILAVGPTTPAALACCATSRRHRTSSLYASDMESEEESDSDNSSSSAIKVTHNETEDEEEEEEQVDDNNDNMAVERPSGVEPPSDADDTTDDSQDNDSSTVVSAADTRETYEAPVASQRPWVPHIRHESCINTAAWLDGPWRLAVSTDNTPTTVASWEAPTQLITSGDDHLVKFWDVRHAMGSTSPLQEGWDVFAPFSTLQGPSSTNMSGLNGLATNRMPPGAVLPLATLVSGHLGNVFHVTPVPSTPGLVLTCGADGQLRSCHVEREKMSKLVMRPMSHGEDDSDSDSYFISQLGIAYSHQLLTADTGLLCSDRGLFHFDLRVPPREQPRQPFKLVPNKERGWRSYVSRIKSCAVWSPSLGTDEAKQSHLVDSNYVFAGGSGEEVHMFDLRMESSREESNRVVERYRPRVLKDAENVSVCGIDVSKDGRELLVSYESDQIYTFPIFNQASSPAGPTLEEIDKWSSRYLEDADEAVPDLASYGAHLNRFTFLKSARYAGPKDEYICTGSDSGHAWIYRKSDGAVASLLSADSHVCNGIVPHPTLPVFITYGIDSTAKVWRATLPLDSSDSNSSRATIAQSRPYQMSPVVKNPEQVQQRCTIFEDSPTEMTVFPDFIPTTQEVLCAGRFMPNMLWSVASGCDGAPRIGNALRTLPYLLRSNRYECCKAVKSEREGPIEGPLEGLANRVSRMRLQHQADQIGVAVDNKEHPYLWRLFDPLADSPHPADMVPDFPSDWIQWDPAMDQNPQFVVTNFTLEENPTIESREEASSESISSNSSYVGGSEQLSQYPWLRESGKGNGDDFWWPSKIRRATEASDSEMDESGGEDEPASSFSSEAVEFSRKALYYTALLCKEGGSEAIKNNMLEAAARRYDKSIQYCAVAFLKYEGSADHVPHLTAGMSERIPLENCETSKKAAYVYTWCPLLYVWISCHLNLALIFLKPDLCKFQSEARNQAEIALRLLAPYTRESGKVYYQSRLLRDDEPEETYRVARQLQAKAYFRLGSAEFEMGDYISATKSLEASIASTDGPVDPATLKRLNKAKSRSLTQKKRSRRRFEVALAGGSGATEAAN